MIRCLRARERRLSRKVTEEIKAIINKKDGILEVSINGEY